MTIQLIGILAALSYAAATWAISKEILGALKHRLSLMMAWSAVTLHGVFILMQFQQIGAFDFGFFSSADLVTLVVTLLLLFSTLDKPVANLGIGVFPFACLALIAHLGFYQPAHPLSNHDWEMGVHVLSSIIAFSLLNIAALQAVLLAIQERQLRRHQPRRLILALPPLQAMESLLFQMLTVGLLFLTASLISGFIFIDDLFAQHLVHKTVLSIAAWIVFGGLLIGRLRYGWRGQTAIRWTLIGFVVLLLAYFGSKLVLELILKRV